MVEMKFRLSPHPVWSSTILSISLMRENKRVTPPVIMARDDESHKSVTRRICMSITDCLTAPRLLQCFHAQHDHFDLFGNLLLAQNVARTHQLGTGLVQA